MNRLCSLTIDHGKAAGDKCWRLFRCARLVAERQQILANAQEYDVESWESSLDIL
jgi:hypothetical protein